MSVRSKFLVSLTFRASVAAFSLFAVACGVQLTPEKAAEEESKDKIGASKISTGDSSIFSAVDVSKSFDEIMGYSEAEESFGLAGFSLAGAESGGESGAAASVDVSGASDADAAIIIEAFDADGDGVLSEGEAALAEKEHGEAQAAWKKSADADGNGELSKDEKKAGVALLLEAVHEKRKQKLVELFDLDGDQKLSEEEKAPVKEARKAQIEERKTIIETRIKEFDANGDGKLSTEELEELRNTLKEERAEHAKEHLKKFDKDGDGKLSEKEMKPFGEEKKSGRDGQLPEFDKNGNGYLDPEERKAIREGARDEAEKMRKAVDTNGDGKVSPEEHEAFMKGVFFQRFDENKDGKLDDAETAALEEEMRRKLGVVYKPGEMPQAGEAPLPPGGGDTSMPSPKVNDAPQPMPGDQPISSEPVMK